MGGYRQVNNAKNHPLLGETIHQALKITIYSSKHCQ